MTLTRKQAEVDERSLGMIRLWRDDLLAMVETIAEASTDIKISTDQYDLDAVEDLSQIRDNRINSFELSANSDQVVLKLRPKSAVIIVTSPDLKLRGMATEVEGIARRCRRPVRDRLPIIALILGIVLLAVAGISAAENPHWLAGKDGLTRTPLQAAFLAMLFVFLLEAMFGIAVFTQPKSGAVIFTRNRAEAPPWGSRNKDALVTNAIVSFVFLIIGVVVGYLLPR